MNETHASRRMSHWEWFAWALPAGFLVSFFTAPLFAVLLALSLGALAAASYAAWRRESVAIWLAVPATGVFALLTGSFVHGFVRHPEMKAWSRVAEGAAETVAIALANGHLPIEGTAPLAPWWQVAAAWIAFSSAGMLLCRWDAARRAAAAGTQIR